MRASAFTGVAAAATALAVVLSGCGSVTKTATSSSSSSTSEATTSKKPKVPEPSESPAGPNPTIADYIKKNGITETPIKMDDATAPKVTLPVPEGWESLSAEDTQDWVYRAISYDGPDAGDDPASIAAVLSKLTGKPDPQAILGAAPGELRNLPGFRPTTDGATSALGQYPAYQLGGTWVKDGVTHVVAQKTVVIPAADGLYVLQLNSDGLEPAAETLGAATAKADSDTTITT